MSARVAKDAPRGPAGRPGAGRRERQVTPRLGPVTEALDHSTVKLTINPDWAPLTGGESLVLGWAGPELNFDPAPRGDQTRGQNDGSQTCTLVIFKG